jgi:hypothetical protein
VAAETGSRGPGNDFDGLMIGFVDGDGTEQQVALENAAQLSLECCSPVRTSVSYQGQRNWPGLWWAASTGSHVGYQSWLERDHVMLLDFDPDVMAFAPHPFWIYFDDAGHRHGSGFLRPPPRRRRDRDGLPLRSTSQPSPDCRLRSDRAGLRGDRLGLPAGRAGRCGAGWQSALAGYRHPRFADPAVADRLDNVFAAPEPLLAGAGLAGPTMAVLPVLFHLLWRHDLNVELTVSLTETSMVWT